MSDLESMPGKLDALAIRVGHVERALEKNKEALEENTEITMDIRDALGGLRVFGVIVKWVGGVAAGITAMWVAWTHLGGGK